MRTGALSMPKTRCHVLVLFFLCALIGVPAAAEDRQTIGTSRLFNNDFLGDGQDRWRTSSYSLGIMRAPTWNGMRPTKPGDILEFRYRSEIIAPENLTTPGGGDRGYAGVRSLGLHTHFQSLGYDVSVGLDMVFTGEQTGQGDLQTEVHDALGIAVPSDDLLEGQVDNALYPTALLEVSRTAPLSAGTSLRPFVEATLGVEDSLRFGADLVIGRGLQNDLLVRDAVTGHLVRGSGTDDTGFGLVLGADYAAMGDSVYLPEDEGFVISDRTRLRAGVHVQGERGAIFYGLTWLGKEFEAQDEDQVLGSIRLQLDF